MKSDPQAKKEYHSGRKNRIIGLILYAGSGAFFASNIGRDIDAKFTETDARNVTLVGTAGAGAGLYLMLRGNRQFFRAIDIYNGDVDLTN